MKVDVLLVLTNLTCEIVSSLCLILGLVLAQSRCPRASAVSSRVQDSLLTTPILALGKGFYNYSVLPIPPQKEEWRVWNPPCFLSQEQLILSLPGLHPLSRREVSQRLIYDHSKCHPQPSSIWCLPVRPGNKS